MEIDTAASVSLISEQTFQKLWYRKNAPGLRRPLVQLRTYSSEQLKVIGKIDARVRYDTQVAIFPLIFVQGNGPILFGRNWMTTLRLRWDELFHTEQANTVQSKERQEAYLEVIARYPELFKEELGY